MKHRREGYVAALLLLALLASPALAQAQTRLTFLPESKIWVEGTSTLKDWSCKAADLQGSLDVDLPASEPEPAMLLSALGGVDLAIPVAGLGCKNDEMHKKLQKALQEEVQPTIRYELIRIERITPEEASEGNWSLVATGRLRLAGQERTLQTPIRARILPDGRLRFEGSQPIQMSDFGIDPPTALLGTLKTGDRVTVFFDLVTDALSKR
jgi:hypothetical protein